MTTKAKYPNAVTYALLMEGLCSIGKYDAARKLMFDMEYRGCKSGQVNFGVLMSDLGKRGKIEEARSLLVEMKRRRFKPDAKLGFYGFQRCRLNPVAIKVGAHWGARLCDLISMNPKVGDF
ncbi:hypothetical protein Syun_001567 [Stephania yunnanensis]|uniref:Pentatricopeptide repeat-containing protein n=1 Tax=Stephania yunnanensis TaxID=152371 RepID=A0AAP0LFX7_9MAGN